jgi:hypothetical protein
MSLCKVPLCSMSWRPQKDGLNRDIQHKEIQHNFMSIENVLVFELQSIRIIDCNITIQLTEREYLKMTKAIWIIEF